jgi:hypothetical protein
MYARLMSLMVVGVAAATVVTIGSQLPYAPNRSGLVVQHIHAARIREEEWALDIVFSGDLVLLEELNLRRAQRNCRNDMG